MKQPNVQVSTNYGKKEHKEVLLEEHDPIWLEIRDLHIADVGLAPCFKDLYVHSNIHYSQKLNETTCFNGNIFIGIVGMLEIDGKVATIWVQK